MQHKKSVVRRVMVRGALLTLGLPVGALFLQRPLCAAGFLIGSLISLFSFATLALAIPMLARPASGRPGKALVKAAFTLKLPIYVAALALLVMVAGHSLSGILAGVGGIILAPALVVATVLGDAFADLAPRPKTETTGLSIGEGT